ncbi:MAG: NAD-binding protein, partial [Candidatus Aenigmarchaeota archaeon]|nr:NAD-binding protein [Candidatus Aenigmarchaeota archaeon]
MEEEKFEVNEMYVIVVGGGKVGLPLAETLAAHKHDVVIIESDKKKCESIVDEFNGIIINGEGNDIDVLKEAKIEKADVFVAVTP